MKSAPTGRIEADFCVQNSQTRLRHLKCAAPLKIAKTWARADGGLQICAMDCSPGLLAGDFYQTVWRLDAGAKVEIGTQGFTRVHPSREVSCQISTRMEIENGALLEWFPEPLVLFENAALEAQTEVFLAPNATFLVGEVWCAGRIERGEKWAFHRFQNRWRVHRDEKLVWASALDLRPAEFNPEAVGAWHHWTHSATFFAFSSRADDALKDRLWEILDKNRAICGGATSLSSGGVMVSLLGMRAHDLQEVLRALHDATRAFLEL